MEFEKMIECKKLNKKFKNFELSIEELNIPKGYCTALIGENGAGKTTLINCMTGVRRDYKGSFKYFGQFNDDERESNPAVKEAIGYTSPNLYFLPHWTIKQVESLGLMLFTSFDVKKFEEALIDLEIFENGKIDHQKKISEFSTGNKMKVELAYVLARDTKCLILDEPASPLDPLMRDKLCKVLRDYLNKNEGENTIFCSTHDILDMEQVTDYAVFMAHGNIVEQGFVEDLKEKYVVVKGEKEDAAKVKDVMFTMDENGFGFEGICLASNLDKLAGIDVLVEKPSLNQLAIAIIKKEKNHK